MPPWRYAPAKRALCLLGLLLLVGCRGPMVSERVVLFDASPQALVEARQTVIGRIIHINDAHQYAVLECEVLPSGGEEAKVYNEEAVVCRLRITEPIERPFVTADILEGATQVGDKVVMDITWANRKEEGIEP